MITQPVNENRFEIISISKLRWIIAERDHGEMVRITKPVPKRSLVNSLLKFILNDDCTKPNPELDKWLDDEWIRD